MKYLLSLVLILAVIAVRAQSITGTWQQVDEKACITSEFKESETEKELLPDMGGSHTSVARLITFDVKGQGKEGIFSKGVKKGNSMEDFKYTLNGQELQFLDKKAGIMTQRFIVDELSSTTLVIHNALKECEARTFTRIK